MCLFFEHRKKGMLADLKQALCLSNPPQRSFVYEKQAWGRSKKLKVLS
jgi:hypothetical protein